MKLLSVILPIYNIEQYLEKCIRSLEAQDIPKEDYEIICINDGSPDNSRNVVLRLQKEFHNIILIDQQNKGVSQARNQGIEKANGRYLIFIDPDDFIQENSLDRILKAVAANNAQLGICGYIFHNQAGNIEGTRTYDHFEEKVFTGIEAYYLTREKGQIQADLSVGILFEADFLNKNYLRYLPDVPILEDAEFLSRVYCLADRCIFIKGSFYVNIVRPGSAMHSRLFISEQARTGFQLAAANLKKFQQMQSLNERQFFLFNKTIVQFILLAIYSALKTKSLNKCMTTISRLKASKLDKLSLEGCTGYYLICGKLYNFSNYLGALALAIYLIVLALYLKINNGYHPGSLKRGNSKKVLPYS